MKEKNPYIFPFLWIKGENKERVLTEIEKIQEAGIDEFVVESRTHPHFLEDAWWQDFHFILETAKRKGMRVWLLDDAHFPTGYANGAVAEHPELQKKYLNYNVLDVFSEGYLSTINLNLLKKPRRKWYDTKKPKSYDEAIEKNRILAVTAFPLVEGAMLSNQPINLLDYAQEEYLNFQFPKGNWRVFVVYETTENGGQKDYINMLDKASVRLLIETVYQPHFDHFEEYFGETFRGFFSDEPGFGNATGFAKDEIIGQKDMALPWSTTLSEQMQESGEKAQYLPLLWADTMEGFEKVVRLKYMNHITQLYSQNFSQQLGEWCRNRQVLYIGHIIEDNNMHARLGTGAGHYFRAMQGQDMAGIDVISGQVTIGGDETFRTNSSKNDGVFYQYCLPKLADSAALLDGEKDGRAFCELYGAYGWQLSIRNMKWILDSLLVRGINHFVPHAFSMDDFPDLDSPPHFYAQGNNPQYPLFKKLMHYAHRMSHLLNGGRLNTRIGILYHCEFEWLGNYQKMQEISKEFSQKQIDFLYISTDWLEKAKITPEGFEINGQLFEKLVIPATDYIPEALATFVKKVTPEQVIFVDRLPKGVVADQVEAVDFNQATCCSLTDLTQQLATYRMIAGDQQKIAVRHYQKEQQEVLLFHNEALNESLTVVPEISTDNYVYRYDGLTDCYTRIDSAEVEQEIAINPYELLVLIISEEEIRSQEPTTLDGAMKGTFKEAWQITLLDKGTPVATYTEKSPILAPVSEKYPHFSGSITYSNQFEARCGQKISLQMTRVFDGCEVYLNNRWVDTLIAPPYELDLSEQVIDGTNSLKIVVSTTADRGLQDQPLLLGMFEPMEPTGIVGEVTLSQKKIQKSVVISS